jgi:hypothetical protein
MAAACWFSCLFAAFALSQVTLPKIVIPPFRGIAKPLTTAQKISVIGKSLTLHLPVKGITGLVALTPQHPFEQDAAYIEFNNAYNYESGANRVYGLPPDHNVAPYNLGFYMNVTVQVKTPGKPHLLTFYVDSNGGQDFRIDDASVRQTSSVAAGPQTITYAFIPQRIGPYRVQITPTSFGYYFSKLEVDVVN